MPKKGVRKWHLNNDCRFNQRQQPALWRKALTRSESTRCGRTPPSEDRRHWSWQGRPSTPGRVCRRSKHGISMRSSSTLWARKAQSRQLKTITHWYSSWTSVPPSPWSRRLARNSITSKCHASTLSSDPTGSKRHTSSSLPNRTPLILPTKSALCEKSLWFLYSSCFLLIFFTILFLYWLSFCASYIYLFSPLNQ